MPVERDNSGQKANALRFITYLSYEIETDVCLCPKTKDVGWPLELYETLSKGFVSPSIRYSVCSEPFHRLFNTRDPFTYEKLIKILET